MKINVLLTLFCMLFISSCSTYRPIYLSETTLVDKEENTNMTITEESEKNKEITFEIDGHFYLPDGTINEVAYFLPGYKSVSLNDKKSFTATKKILDDLKNTPKKTNDISYSIWDGAGLTIGYSLENEKLKIQLYTAYNMKTIYLRITGEEKTYYSEYFISEPISQSIHEISGWEEFQLESLKDINNIKIQVVDGYQANDTIITLDGENVKDLLLRIIDSAEIADQGNSGYNIKVEMYRDNNLLYNGYLSGDSYPAIGIESQYFKIGSDIVTELYEKLGYDMPVS